MQRKSLLVLFFKVFVLAGVLIQGIYLYVYKPDLRDDLLSVFENDINYELVIGTVLLMLLNWSLEAVKWQYIIKWVKEISFVKAIKTVLLGLAFSFFTPRGIGEYFARAYTLDVNKKMPVVLSLLLARMSQLLVLVIGGLVGALLVLHELPKEYVELKLNNVWIGVVGLLLSALVVGVIILKYKVKVCQVVALLQRSGLLRLKVLLSLLYLSTFRYLTYCLQFALLVLALGVENVSFVELFGAVMLTFFVKALVPVFNFMSDLGVREVFSVIFLSIVGVSTEVALGASLLLWFINIVFPTMIGAVLVFKTKITW